MDEPATNRRSTATMRDGHVGKIPQSHPLVRSLSVLSVVMALCLIPLRIISYGYMPIDDALRHVAKAVCGRPWQDIIVMRDGMAMDSHPGWHGLLGAVHHLTGMGMDSLVVFSVVGLALVFLLTPLLFAVRAEAWAIAVGIVYLALDGQWIRPFYGRPVVLTMAAVTVFCLMARKLCGPRDDYRAMAVVGIGILLSVWVNCTWYLWALPVGAMLLARQWRGAARTAILAALGIFGGASLTGNPFVFLWLNVHHLLLTMGNAEYTRQLAAELQPLTGMPIVMVAALFLVWRRARGRRLQAVTQDPAFILMAMGWFLGVFVGRFLLDWGLPALAAWITIELRPALIRHFPRASFGRLGLALAVSLIVFALFTRDIGARWTASLRTDRLSLVDANDPTKPSAYADWLPAPGGIFYSNTMYLFYSTFYANPQAKWKYIVGFEPGWMPDEDLRVYRNIQWTGGAFAAYAPWVKKMRPEDRLVLDTNSSVPPAIPGLEWRQVIPNTWIGRLPRASAAKTAVPVAVSTRRR